MAEVIMKNELQSESYRLSDESYKRLKQVRKNKRANGYGGITQKEMAQLLGISQAYYSAIENKKSALSVRVLEQICRILHVRADYILCLSDHLELDDLSDEDKERLMYNVKVFSCASNNGCGTETSKHATFSATGSVPANLFLVQPALPSSDNYSRLQAYYEQIGKLLQHLSLADSKMLEQEQKETDDKSSK